ncbi:ABC-2 type transporter [Morganella morganii]|nr:ABC-2 type transporter [Morganella morganii]
MYELWLLTFPFLLGVLGLGKLVTECLRSVEMIYLTLAFVTTPVFYMSGTIWPLQAMPDWGAVYCFRTAVHLGDQSDCRDQPDGFTVQQRAERYYYDAGARDYLYAGSGYLSVCCVTGNYGVLRIPCDGYSGGKKEPVK